MLGIDLKITIVAIQRNTAHPDPSSTSRRIITQSLSETMADKALKQTPYESMTVPTEKDLAICKALETLQAELKTLMEQRQAPSDVLQTGADPSPSHQLLHDTGAVYGQTAPQPVQQTLTNDRSIGPAPLNKSPVIRR